jgi:hypothetical protein
VDQRIHVFTLRFWREPRETENAHPLWRGVIIHLESSEQAYFKDLSEMIEFIAPYLETMGTPVTKKPKRSVLYRFLQALRNGLRE